MNSCSDAYVRIMWGCVDGHVEFCVRSGDFGKGECEGEIL